MEDQSELQVPEHLFGYHGDPRWRDMSDYLVHFTKSESAFTSILADGFIRPSGPFGWDRKTEEVKERHRSACLSEVPLDQVSRLIKRHGHYGIAFSRDFIRAAGGARVWYLDMGSPASQALFDKVGDLQRGSNFASGLWKLTPFIDLVMPGRYQFEWEREWRVPGGVHFTLADVAFAVTPAGRKSEIIEELHRDAPFVTSDGDTWWSAVPAILGDHATRMIGEFLTKFRDPVEVLPWDGGYQWIVKE